MDLVGCFVALVPHWTEVLHSGGRDHAISMEHGLKSWYRWMSPACSASEVNERRLQDIEIQVYMDPPYCSMIVTMSEETRVNFAARAAGGMDCSRPSPLIAGVDSVIPSHYLLACACLTLASLVALAHCPNQNPKTHDDRSRLPLVVYVRVVDGG